MPLTVIIRSVVGSDARLTFDGMQRVVIGRGASCDVRLPDTSVSHRHACLLAKGAEFVVVDEGSTNGTFVGQVRVASRTSRLIRSGDLVRVGRVLLELRIDRAPVTRDLAAATRDLALALVSQAMTAMGQERTMRIRVVEGADQGAALSLADEGRDYMIGRGAQCDLPLSDQDASREHARVTRRGNVVAVRTLAAKNGTWLGGSRAPDDREVVWRPAQMVQIGRTVLALEEPVADALASIEGAPDEALPVGDPVDAAERQTSGSVTPTTAANAEATSAQYVTAMPGPMAQLPQRTGGAPSPRRRGHFSVVDMAVMMIAIAVLAVSIAGLVWLLHG
ncbi:MAG: FHA domain-containing protein [Myxococcota bacterium]|nr:FHA domain-containing protein [Myxococcota bacterium]